MTAPAVAGLPDATTTIRAKSGVWESAMLIAKAARLAGGDDAANIAKLRELLFSRQDAGQLSFFATSEGSDGASFVGRLRPGNCGLLQSCSTARNERREDRAGIALTLKQMTDRGWEGDLCFIRPDKTAGQTVEHHLASANYACVVIGAGVRLPPQGLEVFEAVVNAVHRGRSECRHCLQYAARR